MLRELYMIGQQLLHMIGMGCLLWGTFLMVGAMFGNRDALGGHAVAAADCFAKRHEALVIGPGDLERVFGGHGAE